MTAEQRRDPRAAAEDRFSKSTLLGAIGGAMIVGAFLAPLFAVPGAGASRNEAAEMIVDYQRTFEQAREELGRLPPSFQEMVAPAAAHVESFLAVPSLKNLVFVAVDAREVLAVTAVLQPEHATQMEIVRGVLVIFIAFALAMPAIGGALLVRGIVRGFRKPGVVALVASFLAGLVYFAIGSAVVVGVPAASRDQVGIALWLLGGGGLLLFLSGIFAVSRRTWWKAYLLDVGGLIALGVLGVEVAGRLAR